LERMIAEPDIDVYLKATNSIVDIAVVSCFNFDLHFALQHKVKNRLTCYTFT
jgi:hypothetical protein